MSGSSMASGAWPATFGARFVARHDVPLSIAEDPFFPEDPGIRAPLMSEQFGAAPLEKQARLEKQFDPYGQDKVTVLLRL